MFLFDSVKSTQNGNIQPPRLSDQEQLVKKCVGYCLEWQVGKHLKLLQNKLWIQNLANQDQLDKNNIKEKTFCQGPIPPLLL